MSAAAAKEDTKIETVLGPIEVEALGPTSMHEHVFIDATVLSESPPAHDPPPSNKVDLKSLGYLRWNPTAIPDNLLRLGIERERPAQPRSNVAQVAERGGEVTGESIGVDFGAGANCITEIADVGDVVLRFGLR